MHRAAAKETTSSIWSLETRQERFEPTLLANIKETIASAQADTISSLRLKIAAAAHATSTMTSTLDGPRKRESMSKFKQVYTL
jgi:hypothetical protein